MADLVGLKSRIIAAWNSSWTNNDFVSMRDFLVSVNSTGGNMPAYTDLLNTYNWAAAYIPNCNCDCDCSCFTAGTLVTLEDGRNISIENVKVGDKVIGGFGFINTVEALDHINIFNSKMYIINGVHRTSDNHRHWTTEGWASIAVHHWDIEDEVKHYLNVIVDNDGNRKLMPLKTLQYSNTTELKIGSILIHGDGSQEEVKTLEYVEMPRHEIIYSLVCDGSHTHLANGKIVSGWVHDDDFCYETWKVK